MQSVRDQALLMAVVIGVALAALSLLITGNWWRAARGELPRNPHLGIRTPSTLRTEQSWRAGNRAALRVVPLIALLNVATCAAMVVAAGQGWRLVVVCSAGAGLVGFIGLAIAATVVAGRAARAADDGGPADRPSPSPSRPDVPGRRRRRN